MAVLCGTDAGGWPCFAKIMLIDNAAAAYGRGRSSTIVALVVCAGAGAGHGVRGIEARRLRAADAGGQASGFDPALMASPLITTVVDALSLLVYFNIARAILGL